MASAPLPTVVLLDRSLDPLGGPHQERFVEARDLTVRLVNDLAPVAMVTYDVVATEVDAKAVPALVWSFIYGANLAAGLDTARRSLRQDEGDPGRIIVVAYAEPSTHDDANGMVFFDDQPRPEVHVATLRAAQRCSDANIQIDVRLAPNTPVAAFESITADGRGSVTRWGPNP